ncbi:MAG: hypothetical protein WA709_04175, partial [Stellaceae bacterium]
MAWYLGAVSITLRLDVLEFNEVQGECYMNSAITIREQRNCWLFLAVSWLRAWAKSEGFRG